jgi:hypothetical protein
VKVKTAFWGTVATLVAIFALTSIDWEARPPDNTRPGKPTYVMAKATMEGEVSVVAGAALNGEDAVGGLRRVSFHSGWDMDLRESTWTKQFGPYREGDAFALTILAEGDNSAQAVIQCALQTVGRPQIPRPPQQVAGRNGRATCSIVVGQ